MKGGISLKDFILGVKKELQEASTEGSKNPYLQLTQVELEAEFSLDAKALAEGSLMFLVKLGGETTASQLHKVKLIFSPIKNDVMFAVSPSDSTGETLDPDTGTFTIKPSRSGKPKPPGSYYFMLPNIGINQAVDVDEIVKKAIFEAGLSNKDSGTPGGKKG